MRSPTQVAPAHNIEPTDKVAVFALKAATQKQLCKSSGCEYPFSRVAASTEHHTLHEEPGTLTQLTVGMHKEQAVSHQVAVLCL